MRNVGDGFLVGCCFFADVGQRHVAEAGADLRKGAGRADAEAARKTGIAPADNKRGVSGNVHDERRGVEVVAAKLGKGEGAGLNRACVGILCGAK